MYSLQKNTRSASRLCLNVADNVTLRRCHSRNLNSLLVNNTVNIVFCCIIVHTVTVCSIWHHTHQDKFWVCTITLGNKTDSDSSLLIALQSLDQGSNTDTTPHFRHLLSHNIHSQISALCRQINFVLGVVPTSPPVLIPKVTAWNERKHHRTNLTSNQLHLLCGPPPSWTSTPSHCCSPCCPFRRCACPARVSHWRPLLWLPFPATTKQWRSCRVWRPLTSTRIVLRGISLHSTASQMCTCTLRSVQGGKCYFVVSLIWPSCPSCAHF